MTIKVKSLELDEEDPNVVHITVLRDGKEYKFSEMLEFVLDEDRFKQLLKYYDNQAIPKIEERKRLLSDITKIKKRLKDLEGIEMEKNVQI
ncbi:hypothetical protein DRN97_04415 [Methanosarcinales archaeon]|nr:MAG: hypothetical protein DRN97_04415 [Methanosarcinales archaeon]